MRRGSGPVIPLADTDPARVRARAGRVGRFAAFELVYPGNTSFDLHHHDNGYLCLVLEGAFVEQIRDQERVGVPGTLLRYAPSDGHLGRFGGRGATILHVEIPPELVSSLRTTDKAAPHHAPPIPVDGRTIGEAWTMGDVDGLLTLEELAFCTACRLADVPSRAHRETAGWIATAKELLRSRLEYPLGLEEIARQLDRHPSHVARAFRAATGMTAGDFRRRTRVAQAARLLAFSTLPVSEIATTCGFADQSHLGRAFRRQTGLSPARFRGLTR